MLSNRGVTRVTSRAAPRVLVLRGLELDVNGLSAFKTRCVAPRLYRDGSGRRGW